MYFWLKRSKVPTDPRIKFFCIKLLSNNYNNIFVLHIYIHHVAAMMLSGISVEEKIKRKWQREILLTRKIKKLKRKTFKKKKGKHIKQVSPPLLQSTLPMECFQEEKATWSFRLFDFFFLYGLISLYDANNMFVFKRTRLFTLCVFSGRIPKIFDRPWKKSFWLFWNSAL